MATIYKRRRVWYVDYTDPRTARRVQRSLGVRTKAAAEAARARVELELVEGRTPNVEIATFGRLLEAYLKYCEPRNGSQTMVDKRRHARRFLAFFGDVSVRKITRADVERYVEARVAWEGQGAV